MISILHPDPAESGGGIMAWTDTVEDPRAPLREIADVVKRDVQERWDSETDPWGTAWAPRSVTTLEIRDKQGKDPTPRAIAARGRLVDRGRSVRVGPAGPIARYFHEGDPSARVFGRGHGPRPPRPVLPLRGGSLQLPTRLRETLMDAFRASVRMQIRRARRGG